MTTFLVLALVDPSYITSYYTRLCQEQGRAWVWIPQRRIRKHVARRSGEPRSRQRHHFRRPHRSREQASCPFRHPRRQ